MKILIASGSFKDVYSPSEAVDMLADVFLKHGHDVVKCPFCDGGEYTFDVLERTLGEFEEVLVDDVINVYGRHVQSHYLVDKDDVAHIVSSEILRLYPEEDNYKNPLKLTDYGFGQLILDAVNKGFKNINLYLGGTSTVDFGMGMLQALGGRLYDASGMLIAPYVTAETLSQISKIVFDSTKYRDIKVTVIADGDAKAYEMEGITALKVGRLFKGQKDLIVSSAKEAAQAVMEATGFGDKRPFSGAAGALLYGIDSIFRATYVLGGDYFANLLKLKEKICACDYVVTGEGRYDNTACGKAPASIAGIASSFGKPVALICGQIDKKGVPNYESGAIHNLPEAERLGISIILTCQKYYDEHPAVGTYKEQIDYYRKKTPEIIDALLAEVKL